MNKKLKEIPKLPTKPKSETFGWFTIQLSIWTGLKQKKFHSQT